MIVFFLVLILVNVVSTTSDFEPCSKAPAATHCVDHRLQGRDD